MKITVERDVVIVVPEDADESAHQALNLLASILGGTLAFHGGRGRGGVSLTIMAGTFHSLVQAANRGAKHVDMDGLIQREAL